MRLIFISLLLLCLIPVGYTQDNCDGAAYATELELFVSILSESDTPLETLNLIDDWVSTAIVNCTPTIEIEPSDPIYSYSSQELGQQPVIGPITLPDGLLKITVQTDGFFIGQIEQLSGECIENGFGSLFNLSAGEATGTASNIVGSVGCEMLFSTDNTSEPWTIDFYQIPLDTSTPLQGSYSSDEHGLQAAIGLVAFEDGLYRARVTTEGFFIGQIETLVGECDSGFGSLFNLSKGDATVGAEATLRTSGCVALILTSNAGEPWIMEFEKLN